LQNNIATFFAMDILLHMDNNKLKDNAHEFLTGLLENNCCNFDELLPRIHKHAIKTPD